MLFRLTDGTHPLPPISKKVRLLARPKLGGGPRDFILVAEARDEDKPGGVLLNAMVLVSGGRLEGHTGFQNGRPMQLIWTLDRSHRHHEAVLYFFPILGTAVAEFVHLPPR